MGNRNNNSLQFDDENQDMEEEWQYDDEWEDESIHARKEHQNHRGRGRGKRDIRRNIEDIKEQQQLRALLGDDFDD